MKTILTFFILFWSTISFGAEDSSEIIKLQLNDKTYPARLVFYKESGQHKIFAALFLKGQKNITSATLKQSADQLTVPVKKTKSGAYLLLPDTQGKLLLNYETIGAKEFELKAFQQKSKLKIADNCKTPGLDITLLDAIKKTSKGFAGVDCQIDKDKSLLMLYFSTSEGSEWLGSTLFELDGKGMRWKIYKAPLDGSETDLSFRWEQEGTRLETRVQISYPLTPKVVKEEDDKLKYHLGISAVQQSFTSGSLESDATRANVSGRFSFDLNKKISFLAQGDYLLYSSSSEAEDSSESFYSIKIISAYNLFSELKIELGYFLTSYSTTDLQLNIDYSAPLVGLSYDIPLWGGHLTPHLHYSKPFSDNTGSLIEGGFFISSLFGQSVALGLEHQTLTVDTASSELEAQTVLLKVLYGF